MGFLWFGKKKTADTKANNKTKSNEELCNEALNLYKGKEYQAANQIWLSLAEKGVARAQYAIAVSYLSGEGIEKNQEMAMVWLQKAADQSYGKALYLLADCKKSEDSQTAINLFTKAALAGNEQAAVILGNMACKNQKYDLGIINAVGMYQIAAYAGNADAAYKAGLLYHNGLGIDADDMMAFAMFLKAAELGHREAQYLCGIQYYTGKILAASAEKALLWFEKAAEQGHKDAQYYCGILYGQGDGTAPDIEKATFWLEKAAAQGHQGAIEALSSLKRMTISTLPIPYAENTLQAHVAHSLYAYSDSEQAAKGLEAYRNKDYESAFAYLDYVLNYKSVSLDKSIATDGLRALVLMNETGRGTPCNQSEALYWAEDLGESDPRGYLEFVLRQKRKTLYSLKRTLFCLDQHKVAASNEIAATMQNYKDELAKQNDIGNSIYELGRAREEAGDQVLAINCYRYAVVFGHEEAALRLAEMLDKDNPAYLVELLRLYQIAADSRVPKAEYLLSQLLENKELACPSCRRSNIWLERAVNEDYPDALYDYGKSEFSIARLAKSVATEDNLFFKSAYEHLKKADELGNTNAASLLGQMYYGGFGVSKDYSKALEWFKKGMDQGDPDAQALYGGMMYNGEGIKKDERKGSKLVEEAFSKGSSEGRRLFKAINNLS